MCTITSRRALPVLAAIAFGMIACGDSPVEPPTLVEEVRQHTARFSNSTTAIAAGYQPDEHCVAHPELGGMGSHWVNGPLIDPEFDPMQPEALLYEPDGAGGHRLIGVEYIVINAGQPHPTFDGHPFDVGGVPPLTEAGVPHFSLHVWLHRENPAGMFAPFNPNVSCGAGHATH
jgi:hypothetical protein